jgi:hypothetical protein
MRIPSPRRLLYEGRLAGAELLRIAARARAAYEGSTELAQAVTAVTKKMVELYDLLGGQIYSYREMKRRTAKFNGYIYEQLKLADLSGTFRSASGEIVTLDNLSAQEVRDLLYRPGNMEANHIIQAVYLERDRELFEKFSKVIESADDPLMRNLDATWWRSGEDMPAIAFEAELHTMSPTRISKLYGTQLGLEEGFTNALKRRVDERLQARGNRTMVSILETHLEVYTELFTVKDKPNVGLIGRPFVVRNGNTAVEVTLQQYLTSRIDIARKAGL